jgi:hypothetical protein
VFSFLQTSHEVHTARLDALEDRLVGKEIGAANSLADKNNAWQEQRHRWVNAVTGCVTGGTGLGALLALASAPIAHAAAWVCSLLVLRTAAVKILIMLSTLAGAHT